MPRTKTDRPGGRAARPWGMLASLLTVLGMAGPQPALAQATPPSRGQLLYENHCVSCHSTQMHWRDQRVAVDLASLRVQVLRWQAREQLAWNDADVDDVVRHLNESIYRFPPPTRTGAAPRPPRSWVMARGAGPQAHQVLQDKGMLRP